MKDEIKSKCNIQGIVDEIEKRKRNWINQNIITPLQIIALGGWMLTTFVFFIKTLSDFTSNKNTIMTILTLIVGAGTLIIFYLWLKLEEKDEKR